MSDLVEQNRSFRFAEMSAEGMAAHRRRVRDNETPELVVSQGPDGGLSTNFTILTGEEPQEEDYDTVETPPGVYVFPGRQVGRYIYPDLPGGEHRIHREFQAHLFPELNIKTMAGDGQDFGTYSTDWEQHHSPILGKSSGFRAVVHLSGLVVGYFAERVSISHLYMTEAGEIFFTNRLEYLNRQVGQQPENLRFKTVWMTPSGNVVAKAGSDAPPEVENAKVKSTQLPTGVESDVLVDIDGYVIAIDFTRYIPPDFTPTSPGDLVIGFLKSMVPRLPTEKDFEEGNNLWFFEWAFLILDIASLGQTAIARKALTRLIAVGSRIGRVATRALALQTLGTTIKGARVVARSSWVTKARFGNYFPESGMTVDHFRAAQAAAEETEYVVLMRLTNQKSRDWIARKFPPKDLTLKVKTSKETGLVTCRNEADKLDAWNGGNLVVEKTGNKWVAVGRTVDPKTKAVKLQAQEIRNAEWPLEEGQVLHPVEKKPYVGDYDVLDVIDPKAPGRNMAPAASGGNIKKDWESPLVAKFRKAFNDKLDRKRALHGGQSQFKGYIEVNGEMIQKSQIAGLLEEGAILFRPKKRAAFLPNRDAVKRFYEDIGRPTLMGEHLGGGKVKVDQRP